MNSHTKIKFIVAKLNKLGYKSDARKLVKLAHERSEKDRAYYKELLDSIPLSQIKTYIEEYKEGMGNEWAENPREYVEGVAYRDKVEEPHFKSLYDAEQKMKEGYEPGELEDEDFIRSLKTGDPYHKR